MPQCSAPNCKNRGAHLFPKDPTRRKHWENALRINNFRASDTARLCTLHFKAEDYFGKSRYTDAVPLVKLLRKTAVPSVFWFTTTKQETASSVPPNLNMFPKEPDVKEKWIDVPGRENWFPTKTSSICSKHFSKTDNIVKKSGYKYLRAGAVPRENIVRVQPSIDEDCYRTKGGKLQLKHTANLILSTTCYEDVSEQDAQPGPSKIQDTITPTDSGGREQGPLSQVLQQCRFCGEFSKDCVAVSGARSYLAGNKTALALNDASVQLDFSDRSLPQTVCRHCDAKLHDFCDFVNVVKAAQGTLIKVAEEKEEFETGAEYKQPTAEFEETTADFAESTAEYEEIEILVVKTEDSDDDKEGIEDPLAFSETVFVNETRKRKSDIDTAKPKKLKAKEKCGNNLVIAIKEEVVEKDTNEQSEVIDTETDVKPNELELARSALVFQMAGDGTSEYQGYRSDR